MYKIAVITKVDNSCLADNAAHEPLPDEHSNRFTAGKWIHVLVPVFTAGEILLVEDKKEVSGNNRNLERWPVEYRLFELDQIIEAVKLAKYSTPSLTDFDIHIMGLTEPCSHPSSETADSGHVICSKCGMRLAQ
jgi:hypothetical protein